MHYWSTKINFADTTIDGQCGPPMYLWLETLWWSELFSLTNIKSFLPLERKIFLKNIQINKIIKDRSHNQTSRINSNPSHLNSYNYIDSAYLVNSIHSDNLKETHANTAISHDIDVSHCKSCIFSHVNALVKHHHGMMAWTLSRTSLDR